MYVVLIFVRFFFLKIYSNKDSVDRIVKINETHDFSRKKESIPLLQIRIFDSRVKYQSQN